MRKECLEVPFKDIVPVYKSSYPSENSLTVTLTTRKYLVHVGWIWATHLKVYFHFRLMQLNQQQCFVQLLLKKFLTKSLCNYAAYCLFKRSVIFSISSRALAQTEHFPHPIDLAQTTHDNGLGVSRVLHVITTQLLVGFPGIKKPQTGILEFRDVWRIICTQSKEQLIHSSGKTL